MRDGEYASIRLRLPSVSAIRLAPIMVTTAIQNPTCTQVGGRVGLAAAAPKPITNTRMKLANAAAFTPVDISEVTGVGAPS